MATQVCDFSAENDTRLIQKIQEIKKLAFESREISQKLKKFGYENNDNLDMQDLLKAMRQFSKQNDEEVDETLNHCLNEYRDLILKEDMARGIL